MQINILIRSTLLLLITIYYAFAIQSLETPLKIRPETIHVERVKRGVSKPGFVKTFFSVIYDQWVDTKNTFHKINTMINDNFLPEGDSLPQTTTVSSDPNVTTTPAPYKITRSEFNRILRRNLKGLARLFNIELREALKHDDRHEVKHKRSVSD